jgi:hypothetical protein
MFALLLRGATVYIGGRFKTMGGLERWNAAAVDAASGLAVGWNPRALGDVTCFAADGNAIYAGGSFGSIWEWVARRNLAAIEEGTGRVLPWQADVGGGYVEALAISQGTLFVGGQFTDISGVSRTCLGAVDAASGAVNSWDPEPAGGYYPINVQALACQGNTVYVGGDFALVGGVLRANAAAFDATIGSVLP